VVEAEKHETRNESEVETAGGFKFNPHLRMTSEDCAIAQDTRTRGGHDRRKAEHMIDLTDDAANQKTHTYGKSRRRDVH
jgi:hypothetical protein